MSKSVQRKRCAIYTRKSTEEGLQQDFNSLDAQREAAEAFIASQRHEGWVLLDDRYDDGGFTGANMDRPALKRLMEQVENGTVDCIVVYKVDRLSRSLMDFAKLVAAFDAHGVSFVSVTQQFNTSTSMGRLTLNILLSFAQFERELCSERVRDKFAAAKRKGKYIGGTPILGYTVDRERKKLLPHPEEAKLVRHIFHRFSELGSGKKLADELNATGHRTKAWTTKTGRYMGGKPWDRGRIYKVLHNRTYIGQVTHLGVHVYPGEHDAIVEQASWDRVHAILAENAKARANSTRSNSPAILKGAIRCAACDCTMGPTHTTKAGRMYRYYVCQNAQKRGYDRCTIRSIPAATVESAVVEQLRGAFRSPEIIAKTYREARALEAEELERLRAEQEQLEERLKALRDQAQKLLHLGDAGSLVAEELRRLGYETDTRNARLENVIAQIARLSAAELTEAQVVEALQRLDPLWDELFPGEQARIVRLLVDTVEVSADGLDLRLRSDGLRSLVTSVT